MPPLVQEIQIQSEKFAKFFDKVSEVNRKKKLVPFTWGDISPQDLLAYQIGWGNLLLHWYQQGIDGKDVMMPGEGFTKWDYQGLANHFFRKYRNATIRDFLDLVQEIIDVVKNEHVNGRLSIKGAFAWCSLPSGKQWTLGKWVRVNTCAPYKRAVQLLKKSYCCDDV